MIYQFLCSKCGNEEERDIPMSEYDKEKNNQFCSKCNSQMQRVIEWEGGAYNLGGYSEVGGVAKWQSNSSKNKRSKK